jgi:hypothetical protein
MVDPARGLVGHGGGFPGISSNLDLFRRTGHAAVVLSNYGWASFPVVARMQALGPCKVLDLAVPFETSPSRPLKSYSQSSSVLTKTNQKRL